MQEGTGTACSYLPLAGRSDDAGALKQRSGSALETGGVGGDKRITPPGSARMLRPEPPSPLRGGKKIYVDGRDPRVVARGQAKPGHDERN